LLFLL